MLSENWLWWWSQSSAKQGPKITETTWEVSIWDQFFKQLSCTHRTDARCIRYRDDNGHATQWLQHGQPINIDMKIRKGGKAFWTMDIITSLSEGHSCEQYDFIDLRKLLSVEINRRLLLNAECSCWFFLLPHFAAILLIRDHTFPHDVQRKCPKYASLVRASSTYAVEWHKLWHIKSTFCLSAGGKLMANRLLHIWAHLGGAIEESWLVELGDFNIFPAWNKGSSGWWTPKMDPFNNDPISLFFGCFW